MGPGIAMAPNLLLSAFLMSQRSKQESLTTFHPVLPDHMLDFDKAEELDFVPHCLSGCICKKAGSLKTTTHCRPAVQPPTLFFLTAFSMESGSPAASGPRRLAKARAFSSKWSAK